MSNFNFLKPYDKNLYEIIQEAEKLYRDEYFEQSITQTRRFAENVCKNVLGSSRTCEKTFDDMLATLKDKAKSIQEKEFIDDLYFLKREGNNSVHSPSVKKDGIIALECLQRAFEVSINYAVHYCKAQSKLMKLQYDTELLVTGKKSQKTLSEKYEEEKSKTQTSKRKKTVVPQSSKAKVHKKRISIFYFFIGISFTISIILVLLILLLNWI